MTWIQTIAYPDARGELLKLYDRIKGPGDNVDNIMMAHSLRPHTLEGHMALYKYVLHHPSNTVEKWFLEVVGILTSLLNSCHYCVEHHSAGLSRLLDEPSRASAIRVALESRRWNGVFNAPQAAALDYAAKLTERPAAVDEDDVRALREVGWKDGEILEINQAVAYFGYANRTVLGLGVNTQGDVLGLSPNDSANPANWQHQ